MLNALILVAVLVAASLLVSRINARHEARGPVEPVTPEQRVAVAWDAYGADDDLATMRARVDPLLEDLDVEALASRNAVVSLAVMCVRAERFEVLPALARRARSLDGGCGETAALGVLAEACAGDPQRARELFAESQGAMAGCTSCGSKGPGRYLMQEVAVMLDAMDHAQA